jgi:hypothetical protein
MRKPDAHDLLALWERGASRHAHDRSALLCAWAQPELPVESIADLPLGEITASVLRLRAACFGERIRAHLDCAGCGERLQLSISINDVLQPIAGTLPRDVTATGVRYRLPCLRDLAAVAGERDTAHAARLLLARCRMEGVDDDAIALSETGVADVENALEAADPNADISFEVRCEACGHLGVAQLDAAQLLWDEIDVHARALLADVHRLAFAYGWTEGEILALSAVRRASYLSMVTT